MRGRRFFRGPFGLWPNTNRVGNSDARAIRRASRVVGMWVAIACTAIVVIGIAAVFLFILSEISPGERLEPLPVNDVVKVGAIKLLRATIVVGIALIVLAGVLSWLVTRRAVKPLGRALRIQREFVANASHELRTPLAVLDARLQVLQRNLPAEDPSAAAVAELRRDSRALVSIVNDLLEFADIEAKSAQTAIPSDVTPAIEEAIRSLAILCADKGIRCELSAGDPVFSRVPSSGITRCTAAMIDNALRFAPANSVISVSVTVDKKLISICVRDNGPGILGISPSRIFDRFAHAGPRINERGATTSGSGIGLALVRDTALYYGGSVAVVESSPAGTAIAFRVPLVRPR